MEKWVGLETDIYFLESLMHSSTHDNLEVKKALMEIIVTYIPRDKYRMSANKVYYTGGLICYQYVYGVTNRLLVKSQYNLLL